jgi:hypothetical protein
VSLNGIVTALARFVGTSANGTALDYRADVLRRTDPVALPPSALYWLLRQMYLTNGAYDALARSRVSLGTGASPAAIKPIRNVVPAVVDFFASKLWPDPLTLVSDNARLAPAAEQVWMWSNWGQRSRTYARYLALFGECYSRAVADRDRGRAYLEVISPEVVTDFAVDERGYLTMLRLDVPTWEDEDGAPRRRTHVELWEKGGAWQGDDGEPVDARGRVREWRLDGDATGRAVRDLGAPAEDGPLTQYGIDFLPFTRCVFSDVGEPRGVGAVQLALEAIFEADLSATNLHAMLYQDAEGAWVLRSEGFDQHGRPLAPPVVGNAASANGTGTGVDGTISVGKRTFWRLPGNQRLESVVPPIDYAAALAILQDHDAHLERLMPALTYSKISELSGGDLSGRAIRYKLMGAIDQLAAVRRQALAALSQATTQALTLGQVQGVFGTDIGTFDGGDWDHTFEDRDILTLSGLEEAEERRTQAQAAQALAAAGWPLLSVARALGMGEEETAELLKAATAVAEAAGGEVATGGER